jgi:hypothetical protein
MQKLTINKHSRTAKKKKKKRMDVCVYMKLGCFFSLSLFLFLVGFDLYTKKQKSVFFSRPLQKKHDKQIIFLSVWPD